MRMIRPADEFNGSFAKYFSQTAATCNWADLLRRCKDDTLTLVLIRINNISTIVQVAVVSTTVAGEVAEPCLPACALHEWDQTVLVVDGFQDVRWAGIRMDVDTRQRSAIHCLVKRV